ncbi:MAG TPA: cellulase family glycosylhydrolase [Opitutaceae bacterium]|nr:cellulase family glycosylhydrolase [Opitutaceae bacterium]
MQAQLPTPTYGWNLGNTLEPPAGEGAWGPAATQALINSVADAGFNTVRLPVAWDSHANQSTLQIDSAWMARVKQVVDWCYARNLYVVLNIHWDGGWLDSHIGDTPDATVTKKMNSYWTQIANTFKGYDSRLVFAGANEPPADTAAQVATLMNYYQTFINAVRATGGNNSTRWLVIQGPNTNIDKTYNMVNTLPSDSASGRLMVEVHHYPYQWTLMDKDADWGKMFYFWGQGYHSPTMTDRNSTWGEEAYTDEQFQKMATKFTSKGIPVIIGEFGAMKRTGYSDLTGTELQRHLAGRTFFSKYVVDKANSLGIKPIWWDAGGTGSNTMWLFDRNTAAVIDRDNIRALTGGAALPPPGGGGIIANGIYRIVARHSGKALEVGGFARTDGSNVQQWGYAWGENQRWVITHLGNNQYSIIGAQSGKALDVNGAKTTNGTNVQIWTYRGGANQKWTLTATSEGYYRLTPTHATGSCLDVNGVSSTDGANVQIWSYVGGANQQWKFEAP